MGLISVCSLPSPSGCDLNTYLSLLQEALCSQECANRLIQCVGCGADPVQFDNLWIEAGCPVPECGLVIEVCPTTPGIWVRTNEIVPFTPYGVWVRYDAEGINEIATVPNGTPSSQFFQYFLPYGTIPLLPRGAITILLSSPPQVYIWNGVAWVLAGGAFGADTETQVINFFTLSPLVSATAFGPIIQLAADGFSYVNLRAVIPISTDRAAFSAAIYRDGAVLPTIFNDAQSITGVAVMFLASVDQPPAGVHNYQVRYTVQNNPGGSGAGAGVGGYMSLHGWLS